MRPKALLHLGAISVHLGKLETAILLLRQGISQDPSSAEGHNNLGFALHALKRDEEAIACYQTAIALKPEYAIALNNLGAALAAVNRHDAAIQRYREALAIKPDYAEALNNLGASLHALKRDDEAATWFQQALAIHPTYTEAAISLASVQSALGRTTDAVRTCRGFLDAQPDSALVHLHLARTLARAQHTEEAIASYETACALRPDLAEAFGGLAAALQVVGQIARARVCIEKAIAIDPAKPRYYYALAVNGRMKAGDDNLARMQSLAATASTFSDTGRIELHFALGKALADVGDHDEAFRHLLAGNALKRDVVSYDESEEMGGIDRMATTFTANVMRRRQRPKCGPGLPIFILGMPRSGSTLVEQILASHPNVVAGGEMRALDAAIEESGRQDGAAFGDDAASLLTDEHLHRISAHYIEHLKRLASATNRADKVLRVTDKRLENFRHVGLIRLAFPDARIIHTRRNPLDNCLSCFSLLFEAVAFSYDLGELGRRYRAYQRLMTHWHSVLPSGVMLDVQYEDMVANPESQARRLVAHCGLNWDPACLRFYETARPVRTASVVQVRQPIYKDSVKRWHPDPSVIQPLLDALK